MLFDCGRALATTAAGEFLNAKRPALAVKKRACPHVRWTVQGNRAGSWVL